MPLTIGLRELGDVTVLECEGDLRLGETRSTFRTTFRETLKGGAREVGIDLAGVG